MSSFLSKIFSSQPVQEISSLSSSTSFHLQSEELPLAPYICPQIFPWDKLKALFYKPRLVDVRGWPLPAAYNVEVPFWGVSQWAELIKVIKRDISIGGSSFSIGELIYYTRIRGPAAAFNELNEIFLKGGGKDDIHLCDDAEYYVRFVDACLPGAGKYVREWKLFAGKPLRPADYDFEIEAENATIDDRMLCGDAALEMLALRKNGVMPTVYQIDEIRAGYLENFKDVTPFNPGDKYKHKRLDPTGSQFLIISVGSGTFKCDVQVTTVTKRRGLFDKVKVPLTCISDNFEPFYMYRQFTPIALSDELKKFFGNLNCAEELAAQEIRPEGDFPEDVIRSLFAKMFRSSKVEDPLGCKEKGLSRKLFDISRGEVISDKEDMKLLHQALKEEVRDYKLELSAAAYTDAIINACCSSIENSAIDLSPLDYLVVVLIALQHLNEIGQTSDLLVEVPKIKESVWQGIFHHIAGLLSRCNERFVRQLNNLHPDESTSYDQLILFMELYAFTGIWQPIDYREWTELPVVLTGSPELPTASILIKGTSCLLYIPTCVNLSIIPSLITYLSLEIEQVKITRWNDILFQQAYSLLDFSLNTTTNETQAWKYREFLHTSFEELEPQLKDGLDSNHNGLKLYCFILLIRLYGCRQNTKTLKWLIVYFPTVYLICTENRYSEKLKNLFIQAIHIVFKKVKIDFIANPSMTDLVQSLVQSCYRLNNELGNVCKKAWSNNTFQLSSNNYSEVGNRVGRAFLEELPVLALDIWLCIQTSVREVDLGFFSGLVRKLVVLDKHKREQWKIAIAKMSGTIIPAACHKHVQGELSLLLNLFVEMGLFENAFTFVQNNEFSNKVIIEFIRKYIDFLQLQSEKTLWKRWELTQRYNLDPHLLYQEFSAYFTGQGQTRSLEEIQALLKPPEDVNVQVCIDELLHHVIQQKITAGLIVEAARILAEKESVIQKELKDSFLQEIIHTSFQRCTISGIKALCHSNSFIQVLWGSLTKHIEGQKCRLSKTEWEFVVKVLSLLLSKGDCPLSEDGFVFLLNNLTLNVCKLLVKCVVKLEVYFDVLWEHTNNTAKYGLPHSLMSYGHLCRLMSTALASQNSSSELTDEMRVFFSPKTSDFLRWAQSNLPTSKALDLYRMLQAWLGSSYDLQARTSLIDDTVKKHPPLLPQHVLVLHNAYVDKYKLYSTLSENDFKLIESLFNYCQNAKMECQSRHWYAYILANFQYVLVTPETLEGIFECLRFHLNHNANSFDLEISSVLEASSVNEFITKNPTTLPFAKEKWLEHAYFLKRKGYYDLCVQSIHFVLNFGGLSESEADVLVHECVVGWHKLHRKRSHARFKQLFLLVETFPLKSATDWLDFFKLSPLMSDEYKEKLFQMLVCAEEGGIFKNASFERKECWLIALRHMRKSRDIFPLFQEDSLFFQAFPNSLDSLILSDMYLALINAGLRKIRNAQSESAHRVVGRILNLLNSLKEFCFEYDVAMPMADSNNFWDSWVPRMVKFNFWNQWLFVDETQEKWKQADNKLKLLLINSSEAASNLADKIENCDLEQFYEMQARIHLINLERVYQMYRIRNIAVIGNDIIDAVEKAIKPMSKTLYIEYIKLQRILLVQLRNILRLNLTLKQKLDIAEVLSNQAELSSDLVIEALEIVYSVMLVCLAEKDKKKLKEEKSQVRRIISQIIEDPNRTWNSLSSPIMGYIFSELDRYTSPLQISPEMRAAWRRKIRSCSTLHPKHILMDRTPLLEKLCLFSYHYFSVFIKKIIET